MKNLAHWATLLLWFLILGGLLLAALDAVSQGWLLP